MLHTNYDLIVVGAGAAGFFAAISAKEASPALKVLLIEKTRQPLAKVRISGGGRCNVTHSCFDPRKLVEKYPRGNKEMLGPFTRFGPQDTIEWYEKRGVKLKTEEDGRMFPVSDSSESIIQCLMSEIKKVGVELSIETPLVSVEKKEDLFEVAFKTGHVTTKNLLLATGSAKPGWEIASQLGHTLVEPVPSLFTFNCPTSPLLDLAGISVEQARVKILGTKLEAEGPLLITHWGFSGPAVLKLSAFGARLLQEKGYKAEIEIDWQPNEEIRLPKNLAKRLDPEQIHTSRYQIDGKTTFKYEFVTAGGILLKEVNFKTMESKKTSGLYFAGEILDIDGVTGGFNFQNAWTTGWIAGQAIAAAL